MVQKRQFEVEPTTSVLPEDLIMREFPCAADADM